MGAGSKVVCLNRFSRLGLLCFEFLNWTVGNLVRGGRPTVVGWAEGCLVAVRCEKERKDRRGTGIDRSWDESVVRKFGRIRLK